MITTYMRADGCGCPHELQVRLFRGELLCSRIACLFVLGRIRLARCAFLVARTVPRCGRAGHWGVALALLRETRNHGPSPTVSVYIATAQACARAGKWEEATSLMEASSSSAFVTVAVRASDVESVLGRLWCSCRFCYHGDTLVFLQQAPWSAAAVLLCSGLRLWAMRSVACGTL